jgi:hypothetical protein
LPTLPDFRRFKIIQRQNVGGEKRKFRLSSRASGDGEATKSSYSEKSKNSSATKKKVRKI